MRIAIDGDQVLFDFDGAWRKIAEDVLGRPMPPPKRSYHLIARYSLTMSEYHEVWAGFNAIGMWRRCPAIPQSMETVRMWRDHGCEVVVVSALDACFHADRRSCMDALGLEDVPLITVGGGGSKYPALKSLQPALYVDDLWRHCREALEAGVQTVYRIHGGHDGDGAKIAGVMEVDSLEEVRHDRFDRVFAAAR